jgi:hypothetical protein
MSFDEAAFQRQLEGAQTDKAAAELLLQTVGEYLRTEGTELDYFNSLAEVPPVLRCLYFVHTLDIGVCGEGFHSYYAWGLPYDQLYPEVAHGFRLLNETELEQIFLEAIAYLKTVGRPEASRMSLITIDADTRDVHGRYFARHKELAEKIGRYLRTHQDTLFNSHAA